MREHHNIHELANLNPDLMGFIFYPNSKRYVGDYLDPEVIHDILPKIQKVGVFVNELQKNLFEKVRLFSFDLVQLHGNESPDYCREIHKSCKVIKAFGIYDQFDWSAVDPYMDVCEYFLFDTSSKGYGGSGEKFNWLNLANYHLSKPFFLSGGIGPDDVTQIQGLNHPHFAGIDINSKFEIEPGLKNIPLLNTFINEMRARN